MLEPDAAGEAWRALEEALRELVLHAPTCTPEELGAARRAALAAALCAAQAGDDRALGLACAIERAVSLVPRGEVDPAVALPALVMAAATLATGPAGAVAAAWFEIDTLLPVPGAAPRRLVGPDVPDVRLGRLRQAVTEASGDDEEEPWRSASAGWPQELCDRVQGARRRARGQPIT